MTTRRQRDELAGAWSEVKAAVHAYARNPTSDNEEGVELACRRLRHAEALSAESGRRLDRQRRRLQVPKLAS